MPFPFIKSKSLFVALAGASLVTPALSQEDQSSIEEIVVTGQNVYRDRTSDINPTLAYGLDFFQRFEPLTVGEMLKRTPGVVFTSDVLEFDGVQMRGLEPAYTEILINGRKIPGQDADRSFFVDRIPSELVERIEIIRAPSADMSGESVAGSLNIVLKEGAQLEGMLVRIGATLVPEGEDNFVDGDDQGLGTGALAFAGSHSDLDYWVGLNVQERRNPKEKLELYFDDGAIEGYAFEDDTRNGTDYSVNGSLNWRLGQGELNTNAYFVHTDRKEREFVEEYEGTAVVVDFMSLVEYATQVEDIDQDSWGVDSLYTLPVGRGELQLSAALTSFESNSFEVEVEEEYEDGVLIEQDEGDEAIVLDDTNYSLGIAYVETLWNSDFKFGMDFSQTKRDGSQAGVLFDTEAEIEETRFAPYLTSTFQLLDNLNIEAGARLVNYDREVTSEDGYGSQDGSELLPSINLLWDVTENQRFRVSLARTLRRPDFDLVTPFEEDETPDDEDFTVGNPDLDSETSWGVDAGLEHRLPNGGIVGLNIFYREIEDLIEITDTGNSASTIDPAVTGSIFTPRNIGDAKTHGVEFDISTPLAFIGLQNTGFYANYAYMDSSVRDPFTGADRAMRNQPDYVYNLSLTQDIPQWNSGLGVSYQKRGSSLETEYLEYVVTEYDANLEFFAEWNMTEAMVVRLSGTNLLDQVKTEYIRDYGESVNEIQIEESSPTYTLTMRASF